MSRFSLVQPFQVVDRPSPIVVAAPHHGIRPNVSADRGTGPIALDLAERLGARAVVAHDLRAIADVNKNPLRLSPLARGYARRYQDALFQHTPCLVLEIHGHQSGRYEVEVSTGFDLDPTLAGDTTFLEKLARLRATLPEMLAARTGRRPTVGVYPLDRDVAKTATDTFTFHKVRRARLLAGLEWYGLHVELSRELRQGQAAFVQSLAAGLADAFRTAMEPLPSDGATIPIRAGAPGAYSPLLLSRSLRVIHAPERYIERNVVVVHPQELEALEALEGDVVAVHNGHEEIRPAIAISQAVSPGCVALPARLRNQVGVAPGQRVVVGRPRLDPEAGKPLPSATIGQIRPGRASTLWLSPGRLERLGLAVATPIAVQGPPPGVSSGAVRLAQDHGLSEWMAAASEGLAARLGLTLGETIVLT